MSKYCFSLPDVCHKLTYFWGKPCEKLLAAALVPVIQSIISLTRQAHSGVNSLSVLHFYNQIH